MYTSHALDLLRNIRREQQADGSFFSVSVPLKACAPSFSIKSTFTTALILYRLHSVRTVFSENTAILTELKTIVEPAIDFLLSQRGPHWTWNYWPRNSAESVAFPYPDDLDDTFVALSAITLHRPKVITGEVFANVSKTLIRQENTLGGPFRTWILPNGGGLTEDPPDVAVNSNILGFLSLHNIRLPELQVWLSTSLEKTDFISPFYPSTLQPLYFLSRAAENLTAKNKGMIAEKMREAQQNISGPLCRVQYFDPTRNGVRYGNISTALETATKIETLCTEVRVRQKETLDNEVSNETRFLQTVRMSLRRYFDCFYAVENVDWAEKAIIALCEKNVQEMLLPWYFYADMNGLERIGDITEKDRHILLQTCTINIAGWLAYRAYDDILDTSTTVTKKMILRNQSCMNLLNRMVENFFSNKYQYVACWIRQRMDIAIERECVRGKADALQEKSIGCAIGPALILLHRRHDDSKDIGGSNAGRELSIMIRFFRHLLTAKQIHDDCHDWQEDLKKGFVNLAIQNKETTEAQFWDSCFESATRKILFHVQKARKALIELSVRGVLKTTAQLEKYLASIEHSAQLALAEKKRLDDFRKYVAFTEK